MPTCATRGWEYRVAVRAGDSSTLDPNWDLDSQTQEQYFAIGVGMTEIQDHVVVPGTRGTRDLYPDQTVRGLRVAGGPLRVKMGRTALDKWLPRILGAAESSDVFRLANVVPWFEVMIDKGQGKYFVYTHCKVARAMFSGAVGQVVHVDLDIVCKKEEEYLSPWPTLNIPAYASSLSTRPLRMGEGSFVWDPTGTPITALWDQFQLVIDNDIDPGFFAGDDAAQCIDEGMRLVQLGLPAAHTDAVKNMYKRGFEGLVGRLKFTADNMNTQFDFPKLFWVKRSPTMDTAGYVPLPLQMRAYRSDAGGPGGIDDSVTVTNDPVYTS